MLQTDSIVVLSNKFVHSVYFRALSLQDPVFELNLEGSFPLEY